MEVEIAVDRGPRLLPTAREHLVVLVSEHDVAREGEGVVRFQPAAADESVLAKGKDIVADDVVAAVVLIERLARGPVDEVGLDQDVGGALVGVDAPAAVAPGHDVVEHVVADPGAGGDAERVDATHVGKHPAADVVHVVAFNHVAVGSLGVAPGPADADARVIEVMDVIVDHLDP